MLNEKAIQAIGIVTTVLAAAASLIPHSVTDKNLDAKIAEKVAKAVTENTKETEL